LLPVFIYLTWQLLYISSNESCRFSSNQAGNPIVKEREGSGLPAAGAMFGKHHRPSAHTHEHGAGTARDLFGIDLGSAEPFDLHVFAPFELEFDLIDQRLRVTPFPDPDRRFDLLK
jgi:hypothetical protein